jgi:microcin C transport system ATP-binding protein
MNNPLLNVRGLRISFGGKEVVHGLDFTIGLGEKVALVGESGSGKTVTALSLLRLVADAQVSGEARFVNDQGVSQSRDLLKLSERELLDFRGRDIAMIFQEPMTALNPLFSIGDQIAEVLELKMGLDSKQAGLQAIQLLADTGITEPQRRYQSFPHQLSGGQRQRAMIAMALACKPRLLLADEPTTALDVSLRGQILDLLDDLQKKTSMAVLMITHDLNLVRRFAQRVLVMENGHLVEQGAVSEVFAHPQHPYTQRLIASKPQRDVVPVSPAPATTPILKARHLRVSYPIPLPGVRGWFKRGEFVAVSDASFELPVGQTLGVIGESGSGKTTLALAALGLQAFSGALHIASQTWSDQAVDNRRLRKKIQVVFQDPFSSLSPRLTLEEIVGEGLLVHAPGLSVQERRLQVIRILETVGLSEAQYPGLLQRYPHEFSGGQRQRLAIARALIVEPELLVLDEPTSALDVTIQKQVLQLLQRLQRERHLSYLLITHDVDVIRAMAHQVVVMKNGEIVEAGPLDQVFDSPKHPYTRTLVQSAA